jgi:cell wall-associated NlpC family hydrolase
VSSIIGRSAVAPLNVEPSLRSEQVTQLVLGETAEVLAADGMWLRVRRAGDSYEGWLHRGYAIECDDEAAARWRAEATGWSEGAEIETATGRRRLPVRARAALEHGRVRLPDGGVGSLVSGHVLPMAEVVRAALALPAERWAERAFAGVRYEWGGLTECGVDCSGLVQTTFAARGVSVPRDAAQQARVGVEVAFESIRPGDLLFFSDYGQGVTHVAFAASDDSLIHSTVACGGVVTEPWTPGHRAALLRPLFVAARRIPGSAASA